MAVASGIGAQCGVAPETTYGTYVAPTRFLPTNKASVQLVKNTYQGEWVGAGRLMDLGAGRVVTTQAGKGALSLDIYNKGFGILLQALMGTTVTPVQQGATTAYLQTHILADTLGKSLSVQLGLPDTAGVVHPYTALGSKITDATFTFDLANNATAEFTLDARQLVEAQSLAAASYATTMRPFVGTDMNVKIGTFGAEAAVSGVRKASVKIARGLQTDRFYAGQQGLKAEPLVGDFAAITGTLSADYVDKTVFADRFASDAGFSLVVELVGLTIASTYKDTFRITLPECHLDGDTPILDGPGIVSGDFNFTALFDGTNLPKIEYMSSDTTV